jgi:hypothetical protein
MAVGAMMAPDRMRPVGLRLRVFSATTAHQRNSLGELITNWLQAHPECEVFDRVVTQSSSREFHCLTITLFFGYVAAP